VKIPLKDVFVVTKLEELPYNSTFYVIATEESYVSDGGWPGNDSRYTYLQFEVYRIEKEWKDAVKIYTQFKRGGFRAFVMIPPIVNTTTDVEIPTR
jgi:hypothetical protein